MKRIIFATKNKHKMVEIREILKDLPFEIVSVEEAGIDIDIIEDGTTFIENATKKAVEIMKITKEIVLADDSGLEIDYLDKAPGVYSARYLGEKTPYEEKNKAILERLEGVEGKDRSARFVCVIACAVPTGELLTEKGTIEGVIAKKISGKNGFGYDPIFFVPKYNMTTAQMDLDLKNEISHRGKALKRMKKILENFFE